MYAWTTGFISGVGRDVSRVKRVTFNTRNKSGHRQSKEWTENADWNWRNIRDTLYFKPRSFTLNTLLDFVLTYFKQAHSLNMDAMINFSNFAVKKSQKSSLKFF